MKSPPLSRKSVSTILISENLKVYLQKITRRSRSRRHFLRFRPLTFLRSSGVLNFREHFFGRLSKNKDLGGFLTSKAKLFANHFLIFDHYDFFVIKAIFPRYRRTFLKSNSWHFYWDREDRDFAYTFYFWRSMQLFLFAWDLSRSRSNFFRGQAHFYRSDPLNFSSSIAFLSFWLIKKLSSW